MIRSVKTKHAMTVLAEQLLGRGAGWYQPRWYQCKRCRRVYRRMAGVELLRCRCVNRTEPIALVRAALVLPLEAAYVLGGIEGAQEIATPGRAYPWFSDGASPRR